MSSYAATSQYGAAPYAEAGYGRQQQQSRGGYGGGYGSVPAPAYGGASAGGYGYGNQYGGSQYGGQQRGGYGGGRGGPISAGGALGAGLQVVDWKAMNLPPVNKDFYRESASVSGMSKSEVDSIRSKHEIRILSPGGAPNPVMKFEDTGFPSDVLQRLHGAGFTSPSPIQTQSWPILLKGHDMIGIAETGSGKTLAFLLPAVVHINAQEKVRADEGPVALILAPTRELVEQIKDEAQKFAMRMRTGVAYGGAPKRMQIQTLRSGCEIVAACPGRLIDFLERGIMNLRRVTYLVLDEADRMLDMGFEPQIRKIVSQIRPDRQTLMFSATWPKEVQGLARDLCREDPIHVTIGTTDLKASHNVSQVVEVVSDMEKRQKVFELLSRLQREDARQRIIIFTETKRNADVLTRELRQNGFAALGIHGDKEQEERKYVLEEFKNGNHPIMIATDVASRGLDVKNVKVVINYDMPNQIEDYVHRIGRTGRAGASGCSFSYITPDKARLARDLMRIMQEAKQPIPQALQDMAYHAPSNGGGRGGRGGYGAQRRFGGHSGGFGRGY